MRAKTRRTASTAFLSAAVAGAGLVAGPAHAASGGTFMIRQNGALYKGIFTGKNPAGVNATMTDVTKNLTMTCTTATNSGSFPASMVQQPSKGIGVKIGAMSHMKLGPCTLLGTTWVIRLAAPANISGSFYSSGVTRGRLKKFKATVSGPLGKSPIPCIATLTATSVPVSYKNHSHKLYVDPKGQALMSISKPATACPFKSGDRAHVTGTFSITTPTALTISWK